MQSSRYPTDLSDDQWRCIRPHLCPAPQDKDAPGFTAYGPILDAVYFYVLLRAALPFGGCSQGTTSRHGRPSTTSSAEDGASMGPSSAGTFSCASACGHDYWAQNPQPSSAGI